MAKYVPSFGMFIDRFAELCAIRNNTAIEFALNRCIERLRDELRAQALPGQAIRVDLGSDLVV